MDKAYSSTPIEFKITATHGDKTVEVNSFNSYVTRAIEITEEQKKQITTSVIIEPDGSTLHVPTRVYEKNGKWYVEIRSLTNSTYAVIYDEKTFADAIGTWYEKTVNEMGAA